MHVGFSQAFYMRVIYMSLRRDFIVLMVVILWATCTRSNLKHTLGWATYDVNCIHVSVKSLDVVRVSYSSSN
jgi:hypothetical protein